MTNERTYTMTEADRLEQHLADCEAARPHMIDSRIRSLEYEIRQLDGLTWEATVGRRSLTDGQKQRIAAARNRLDRIADEVLPCQAEAEKEAA